MLDGPRDANGDVKGGAKGDAKGDANGDAEGDAEGDTPPAKGGLLGAREASGLHQSQHHRAPHDPA